MAAVGVVTTLGGLEMAGKQHLTFPGGCVLGRGEEEGRERGTLTLTCASQMSLASCSAMRTNAVRDTSFSSGFLKPP